MQINSKIFDEMHINELKTLMGKMKKKTTMTHFKQCGQMFCVIPNLNLSQSTRATRNKNNNSSILSLGKLSSKLPPSILPNNPSNYVLNSDNRRLYQSKKTSFILFEAQVTRAIVQANLLVLSLKTLLLLGKII